MRVQISVPQIIYSAAGTSHDECASEEESRGFEYREGWSMGIGGSQECRKEAGKEEIVSPGWFVETCELCVWDQCNWKMGDKTRLRGLILGYSR